MDWQQLIHNKWFLGGAAGAAALGGFVLYKRKKTTGSTTSDATTSTTTSGGGATLDTTGTDLASWLGNYSGSLQNQLDQYGQTLTGAVTNLQNMQNGSTTPTRDITIMNGNHVTDWLSNAKVSLPQLLALNPSLSGDIQFANSRGYISPTNPDTGGAIQVFNFGSAPSFTAKIPTGS